MDPDVQAVYQILGLVPLTPVQRPNVTGRQVDPCLSSKRGKKAQCAVLWMAPEGYRRHGHGAVPTAGGHCLVDALIGSIAVVSVGHERHAVERNSSWPPRPQ